MQASQSHRLTLFDWAPSPFCLKVRAVLEYKGLEYRRLPVLGPAWFEVKRRGGIGKFPALDIDGRLVTDSTDIVHEIEALFPQPAVLPDGERDRALCQALEDWCDEAIYFIGLHYQWIDAEGAPMVPLAFGKSLLGRVAYRGYLWVIRRQLRGQGIGRKPEAKIAADLERMLDTVQALLRDHDYLLGPEPMLCDFALFGQLTYLARPPKSARALSARPRIMQYIARMRALRRPGS